MCQNSSPSTRTIPPCIIHLSEKYMREKILKKNYVWLIHNLSIIYKELRNNATSPIARGMYMCMEMECKRGETRTAFEGGRTWEKKRGRPPRD